MKKLIIPLGMLLITGMMQAQSKIVPKVIAPNIDANALGVFDKQSVNMSTGTPTIEVLFHTIKVGDLELPIKLQYDASGIKVGQMATSVGLGWSINNSGILTQEVRDKIDGLSHNIIKQYVETPTVDGRNALIYNHQHVTQPYTGDDLETDIYTVNYFGNTIPFFYNYNDNTFISQQKDNTRIVKGTNKWTVTLGDGTEFNFNNMYSRKTVNSVTIPKVNPQVNTPITSPELNDSWYLTDIASKGQTATLEYVGSSNIFDSKGTETYQVVSVLKNTEHVKMISSITTPYEKVVFEYSAEREDLNGNNGKANLLKFIKVYDNYGKLVKQFQLVYDYYTEMEPLPNYAALVAANYKYKRLRLREVKRLNIQSGSYEKYYGFNYTSDGLPNRFSPKQDLWGYYNGKPNNEYMFLGDSSWGGTGATSNLAVDPNYSGLGEIREVIYPTGGRSMYTFESNESAKPFNYDQMIPEAQEVTQKGVSLARSQFYYKGNGKFEIPFTVDAPVIGNQFVARVFSTNCPKQADSYLTTCDYKVMLDGAWLNPGVHTNVANNGVMDYLSVGPHKLQARSSVTEDWDDPEFYPFFSASIVWNQLKSAAEIRDTPILVGGRRVQQIINVAEGQYHTQKFVYKTEDGKATTGSIVTVPYVAMKDANGQPIYSLGSNPLSKLRGQNLVYKRVERIETDINGIANGKTVQYFSRPIGGQAFNRYPFPPPDDKSHTSGQLTREEIFKFDYIADEFKKVEDVNYLYAYPDKCMNETPAANCATILKGLSYSDAINITNTNATIYDDIDWGLYSLEASPFKLLRKTSTKYLDNGAMTTKEEMDYTSNIHNNLTSSVTTFPDQTIESTVLQYAHDKGNQLMVGRNMTGIPLETQVTKTIGNVTKVLSKTETLYPKTVGEITNNGSGLVLPLSEGSHDIQSDASITEVTYDRFDDKGNLQQYTSKGGIPTVIVWGYGKTQPIARIENARLGDIPQPSIDAIVAASEVDGAAGPGNDESAFLTALRTFREGLPNHQVTTYTHDPLIGVRSITPPSGMRETYLYDTFNRLKEVRDDKGNILKEYNYHYKNQ